MAAVLCRVERDEAVAAVIEAEGDKLLGEVAGADVVAHACIVVGARFGAVANLEDSLAQPEIFMVAFEYFSSKRLREFAQCDDQMELCKYFLFEKGAKERPPRQRRLPNLILRKCTIEGTTSLVKSKSL